jgi:hypothetical protein
MCGERSKVEDQMKAVLATFACELPEGDADRLPRICGGFVWSRTGDQVRVNNFKVSE